MEGEGRRGGLLGQQCNHAWNKSFGLCILCFLYKFCTSFLPMLYSYVRCWAGWMELTQYLMLMQWGLSFAGMILTHIQADKESAVSRICLSLHPLPTKNAFVSLARHKVKLGVKLRIWISIRRGKRKERSERLWRFSRALITVGNRAAVIKACSVVGWLGNVERRMMLQI